MRPLGPYALRPQQPHVRIDGLITSVPGEPVSIDLKSLPDKPISAFSQERPRACFTDKRPRCEDL